ncbi:hypothetical protein DFO67_10446 [Modicisalibacter xianhensis]|uniref:Uncharacterized protein n=1 Tax=Modicisalibacter xianhensis TaxID=442341 RepID=A0A4V3GUH4_9GAMM|nr:hypothetical protein [Halomonas xianhensis]TDX30791.1 hypothetical protein DFO67_10446 [Halomonas xianhensis]
MSYTAEQREQIIDRLDRSYQEMPMWVKTACKHAMGAPKHHPETGEPILSFREAVSISSDETLDTLLEDFEDNGDLLPA